MVKSVNKIIRFLYSFYSGKITFKKFLPGIAWFFIVLILICLPGSDLPKTSDWLNKIYFDKWVHAGMFGLLALLFLLPFFATDISTGKRLTRGILITVMVILWGLATEFIQDNFIESRSFDLLDWLADTVGAVISFFISKRLFTTVPFKYQPVKGTKAALLLLGVLFLTV
ncbi:MAG: VanZ family protein [Ferruginibacter sp.]